MIAIGLVALGGAIGSILRYSVALMIPAWHGFPFQTLLVNILGSFSLGLITYAISNKTRWRLFLGTGICGGFTTYSTFVLDIDRLLATGKISIAFLYMAASLLLGTIAALVGSSIGSRIGEAR